MPLWFLAQVVILAGKEQTPALRPVLALHIEGPFDVNASSEMPVFVLYDNGLVIYQLETGPLHYPRFASATLPPDTLSRLLQGATTDAFWALDSLYDLNPHVTDEPLDIIRVWSGERTKKVIVRGSGRGAPEPFATLYDQLERFRYPRARPWLPDSVRIRLVRVDSSCARFLPVAWLRGLPQPVISSPDARVVEYRVSTRDLSRVQKLRQQYGNWDCTPVAIDHTYWGLWYDYPFPGETAWRR